MVRFTGKRAYVTVVAVAKRKKPAEGGLGCVVSVVGNAAATGGDYDNEVGR
jgi:hypothetical protein